MTFRRGFKSQCERRSIEFRKQLDLNQTDPLNANQLAKHLGVTVWSVNDISELSNEDVSVLTDKMDDSWAALTMRIGSNHLVIYKPVPSAGRRNNVIMHELSHIVLGHELSDACVLEDGSLIPGNYCQNQENEADWLAGTLLLPRPALMHIRKNNFDEAETCKIYNVSLDMLTWRVRMTGVDLQISRFLKPIRR